MIKKLCSVLLLAGFGYAGYGQGAAPSSYLRAKGGFKHSDIWMKQVNVEKSFVNTYYCTLGWNAGQEAGGYAGIQDHHQGHIGIFSLWQPSNGKPITTPFVGQDAFAEPFGGEGTGMHVKVNLGWEQNNWYNLVIRNWPVNDHTYFGFWIHDLKNNQWRQVVTMDYPMPGLYFNNSPYAFIEDWVSSGEHVRKVKYRYDWVRDASTKAWKHLNQASFSAIDETRNGIYNDSFNTGNAEEGFFMEIGGDTAHEFPGHSTNLETESQGTDPHPVKGAFSDFTYQYKTSDKSLVATWTPDHSKSPQFSYSLELFDNAGYQGQPVKSVEEIIPHATSLKIDLSQLPDKKYYLRFSTHDIFDQQSSWYISSFQKSNAPTVAITAPVTPGFLTPETDITLKAEAHDAKKGISRVEFFSNEQLLTTLTKSPYHFVWPKVYTGEYTLVAKATNTDGVSSVSEPVHLSVHPLCNSYEAATGSSPAYGNGSNTFDKALDGDINTAFDYAKPNGGYIQLDYGAERKLYLNKIQYYPRKHQNVRMKGAKFQASNDPSFKTGVVTLYTIPDVPPLEWTTVYLEPQEGYRYYRYVSPDNGYCNVAEISLCGDFELTPPADHLDCNGVLSGTAFIDKCGVCAGGNTGVAPGVTCGLGTAETPQKSAPFKIYPNPVQSHIFIKSETEQRIDIKLTDLNGKILLVKENVQLQELSNGISVSKLPKGLYFVIITTQNRDVFSYKIIKD